jgi:hypothetical protein
VWGDLGTIELRFCPYCHGPITYEPSPPGTLWFHVLADGELVFLCPEPLHVARVEA